jgi:hypothetical protein
MITAVSIVLHIIAAIFAAAAGLAAGKPDTDKTRRDCTGALVFFGILAALATALQVAA